VPEGGLHCRCRDARQEKQRPPFWLRKKNKKRENKKGSRLEGKRKGLPPVLPEKKKRGRPPSVSPGKEVQGAIKEKGGLLVLSWEGKEGRSL